MEEVPQVQSRRWVVLAAYMLAAALTQLYWLNFAAIETFLEESFHIPAGQVMWLTLVFPMMQVLLTLPAGLLIDRRGYKFGVGVGVAFTGAFALLRLAAPHSFVVLLASQIGISVGQPFVLNGVTKLAVSWFPPREEATAVGLGSLALFIGMMVALGATPWLVHGVGFETMLMIYAAAGLIGTATFFVLTPSNPPSPARPGQEEEEAYGLSGLKRLLKQRDFLLLGFIALVGIGVFNALATWLEKILTELHGISMTDAGTISAVLVFAGMLGCLVIPIVSDRIGRRRPFVLMTSAIGAACTLVLMLAGGFTVQMINGALLGFFLISALPILLTLSEEIAGPRAAGVSVGYLQMLGNGAAVVLVASTERLEQAFGGFEVPLGLLAFLLLVALVLTLALREPARR